MGWDAFCDRFRPVRAESPKYTKPSLASMQPKFNLLPWGYRLDTLRMPQQSPNDESDGCQNDCAPGTDPKFKAVFQRIQAVVHGGKTFIHPPFLCSKPIGYLPFLRGKPIVYLPFLRGKPFIHPPFLRGNPFIHPQTLIVKTLIHIFVIIAEFDC